MRFANLDAQAERLIDWCVKWRWATGYGQLMPVVVEFARPVPDAVEQFAELVATQPQRREFAEHPTGSIIAEWKSVRRFCSQAFGRPLDRSIVETVTVVVCNRWLVNFQMWRAGRWRAVQRCGVLSR